MSLYRLQLFLKENSHDIVDYWILNSIIHYIRVSCRKNGHLYFVKTSHYEIRIPEAREEILEKNKYYFLEESSGDHESLDHLYDTFLCAFPEHKYKYILLEGYYMMQEKNICFQIKNMSDRSNFGFFLFLELEWFYENIYVVSHEIEKLMLDILDKSERMYLGFLPHYKNFTNKEDATAITNVWDYYGKVFTKMNTTRKLYIDCTNSENRAIHDLHYNEKITDSDDLMFQETVRRQYNKKHLNEKLDKLRHLKNKIIQTNLYYHCIVWRIILKFLLLISRFTKLSSDFHSMVFEMESLVPKSTRSF